LATDSEDIKAFFETQPLLSWVKVELPELARDLYPELLDLYCPECDQKRPFRDLRSSGGGAGMPSQEPRRVENGDDYDVLLTCTGCRKSKFHCWFQVRLSPTPSLQKLGQLPPWELEIPSELRKSLGNNADFYRKTKVCLGQGYGVGACSYMRRVLEDQINPMLELIKEAMQRSNKPEAEIEEVKAAIKGKVFDEKMRIAYQHAPESMIIAGDNPLKRMHDNLSKGLHGLSESECVSIATEQLAILEYVVTELKRANEARRKYEGAVRATQQS
jgi:hypothetical protein